MAGKSLDDVWRQMQSQRQAEIARQQDRERSINEQREKARIEYVNRNKMYESISNPSSSAAAGAGGTPTIEYISILNTIWIYPQYDLDVAISNAKGGSPSIPFVQTENSLSFPTLNDLELFYEVLFLQTEVSQPIGNTGFSLGVGTILRAKRNSRFYLKLDSGITVAEWTLMTQITNQSDLPVGGNSPDGTVGWGLIYCDWNLDGIADAPGDPAPTLYTDPLRFQINN